MQSEKNIFILAVSGFVKTLHLKCVYLHSGLQGCAVTQTLAMTIYTLRILHEFDQWDSFL